MESETSSAIESVEFTIRSAFQTFDDHKVKCSLEWTVLDMKKHLEETCPSNPEASKQKLIFSGKCLKDSQTLREILMSHHRQVNESNTSSLLTEENINDTLDLESPKVIHLVVPPTKQTTETRSNEEAQENELRNRREESTQNSNGTAGENNPDNGTSSSSEEIPNIPGLVTPIITNYDPSNPYHIYYQTYLTQLIQYQHYYATSLRQELNLGESAPLPPFPTMNISFQTTLQQPNNGNLENENNNNQANNDRNNNDRNNNGVRVDYMGIALSAIRFSMLILIMMSYVTLERISIVVGIITVMWFLKMHRDRRQVVVNNNNINNMNNMNNNNNNDENERNLNIPQQPNEGENVEETENPGGEADPLLQPQNNDGDDILGGENNGGEEEEGFNDNNNNSVPQPDEMMRNQNMLLVVWNTSLNLITSFIYSIIPENAGNVNQ